MKTLESSCVSCARPTMYTVVEERSPNLEFNISFVLRYLVVIIIAKSLATDRFFPLLPAARRHAHVF